MPIINRVEARSRRVKIVYLCIYTVLILGALSMLYPMALMIAGSVKSETDIVEMRPVPRYFTDQRVHYRKFLESKYSGQILLYQQTHHRDEKSWHTIAIPNNDTHQDLADIFDRFRKQLPEENWQMLGHTIGPSLLQFKNFRRYRQFVADSFHGSLEAMNREWKTAYPSFLHLRTPIEKELASRRHRPDRGNQQLLFNRFKMSLDAGERFIVDLDGYYQLYYVRPTYNSIGKYNAHHGTELNSFHEVLLSSIPPVQSTRRADWEQFVRNELSLLFIRIDPSQATNYRHFLKRRYSNLAGLNRYYGTTYATWKNINLPTRMPHAPQQIVIWDLFVQEDADLDAIRVVGPRQEFEAFLDSEGFDRSVFGKQSAQATAVRASDWDDFHAQISSSLVENLKRNYLVVLDYILLHGRGVLNTIVYCILAVLSQLIVNPLAAYALSRYRPPSSYKILLICMATMAFPPAVTMIPSFILLRNLNLLNTFAALILPTMANGFWIFLLKGFFDSLPRELYEAADMDGASEWTKFWAITMSMSKPILAVIGLGAFTNAYSNFMYALIIVPDPEMWTLMVWLYQLQTQAHPAVIYASLCLAAIPMFLIFLFAQNIIIRGIVVPVER